MAKRKTLRGPARRYRKSPQRYEDVRHAPMRGGPLRATRLGCRDAVLGQKDPYKPAAEGFVAAYREGYRICDAIQRGGKAKLSAEERAIAKQVASALNGHNEDANARKPPPVYHPRKGPPPGVNVSPLKGARRRKRR